MGRDDHEISTTYMLQNDASLSQLKGKSWELFFFNPRTSMVGTPEALGGLITKRGLPAGKQQIRYEVDG